MNSGTTTVALTAGTAGNGVTEYARAYTSGGFMYVSGGTTTSITMTSLTINAPEAET